MKLGSALFIRTSVARVYKLRQNGNLVRQIELKLGLRVQLCGQCLPMCDMLGLIPPPNKVEECTPVISPLVGEHRRIGNSRSFPLQSKLETCLG